MLKELHPNILEKDALMDSFEHAITPSNSINFGGKLFAEYRPVKKDSVPLILSLVFSPCNTKCKRIENEFVHIASQLFQLPAVLQNLHLA